MGRNLTPEPKLEHYPKFPPFDLRMRKTIESYGLPVLLGLVRGTSHQVRHRGSGAVVFFVFMLTGNTKKMRDFFDPTIHGFAIYDEVQARRIEFGNSTRSAALGCPAWREDVWRHDYVRGDPRWR